jgi:hypothetical protein
MERKVSDSEVDSEQNLKKKGDVYEHKEWNIIYAMLLYTNSEPYWGVNRDRTFVIKEFGHILFI